MGLGVSFNTAKISVFLSQVLGTKFEFAMYIIFTLCDWLAPIICWNWGERRSPWTITCRSWQGRGGILSAPSSFQGISPPKNLVVDWFLSRICFPHLQTNVCSHVTFHSRHLLQSKWRRFEGCPEHFQTVPCFMCGRPSLPLFPSSYLLLPAGKRWSFCYDTAQVLF